MAPHGGQKTSSWTEPDRSIQRITDEGGERRVRPLSTALSKPRRGTDQQESPATQFPQKGTESPSPAKVNKQNSKPTGKNKSNSAGRPIHSFFNAATQKQQGSQYPASPGKLAAFHDEIEAIEDDPDEDKVNAESSQATLSRGSSTALAARKRKIGSAASVENPPTFSQHASRKFRKALNGDRAPVLAKATSSQLPWTERFAPSDLSELAVHKRKVADVRAWLNSFYQGRRQSVLVLKGAAGSGKTTTLRLLCKDIGIELIEWKARAAFEAAADTFANYATEFSEFVARAGKVRGLTFSNGIAADTEAGMGSLQPRDITSITRQQALLVEEFPNTFSKTSGTLQSFRTALAQYMMSTVPADTLPIPIIMVISETLLSTNTASADSFTAHRLLGQELVANPHIKTIEFNPIAPTFLTKALELIVIKEARVSGRRKTPGAEILKHLAETGDIRSAITSLEFLCVRGDEGDWSSKVAFTKPKHSRASAPATEAEREALKLISNRESSLGLFHSVGKVVYNKRVEPLNASPVPQPPPWLSQSSRLKVTETDANTLIDELGTDTSTFIAALHENYALSCAAPTAEQRLDSLLGCMESLSDSDLLSLDRFSMGTRAFSGSSIDTLRQDEMCFQVAVRGLLFSLPYPVHRSEAPGGKRSDAYRMFYPASLRVWRKREEVETSLDVVIDKLLLGPVDKVATSNSGTGVAKWKRGNIVEQSQDQSDPFGAREGAPKLSAQAKVEVLLERLPYMAHILGSARNSSRQHELRDQIRSITRIDGASLPDDDDDADFPDSGEAEAHAEQWSTDRPDTDVKASSTMPSQARTPRKPSIMFQGIKSPVETRVQSLLLEDDDIED
ncbi:Checkpoint protein rad17 [Cercospora zeina]